MATCNKCLHYDACIGIIKASFPNIQEKTIEKAGIRENNCKNFKSASDVVEVVRCKDCAVPHNKWLGCPNLNGKIPPPDFYCARGERKET